MARLVALPVLTFDLFSALLDSRRGGTQALAGIGERRGWAVDARTVYGRWDALNKAAQREAGMADDGMWYSYRDLARQAMSSAYDELDLAGHPQEDADVLVTSMTDWPLWPDVADALTEWSDAGPTETGFRVGLLSNVDDDIFERTRAARLVDREVAMTSQRLRAYKPHARIYTRAREVLGPMVHVATSARDVRGALEADCPVVRLRRPGHDLDPDGPHPSHQVDRVADLPPVVAGLVGT